VVEMFNNLSIVNRLSRLENSLIENKCYNKDKF